jgi:hypothetical protein
MQEETIQDHAARTNKFLKTFFRLVREWISALLEKRLMAASPLRSLGVVKSNLARF